MYIFPKDMLLNDIVSLYVPMYLVRPNLVHCRQEIFAPIRLINCELTEKSSLQEDVWKYAVQTRNCNVLRAPTHELHQPWRPLEPSEHDEQPHTSLEITQSVKMLILVETNLSALAVSAIRSCGWCWWCLTACGLWAPRPVILTCHPGDPLLWVCLSTKMELMSYSLEDSVTRANRTCRKQRTWWVHETRTLNIEPTRRLMGINSISYLQDL
jgi:hypothetical protein